MSDKTQPMIEAINFSGVPRVAPVGLVVALEPYPHLRDEGGCILARDYVDMSKLAWIMDAIAAYGTNAARENGKQNTPANPQKS